jgi:hypothetical protein
MSKDNGNGPQRIVPMIAYEDGVAAIEWLVRRMKGRRPRNRGRLRGRCGVGELL